MNFYRAANQTLQVTAVIYLNCFILRLFIEICFMKLKFMSILAMAILINYINKLQELRYP